MSWGGGGWGFLPHRLLGSDSFPAEDSAIFGGLGLSARGRGKGWVTRRKVILAPGASLLPTSPTRILSPDPPATSKAGKYKLAVCPRAKGQDILGLHGNSCPRDAVLF